MSEDMAVPEWLLLLTGRQTLEVEGLRDALRRVQEEKQLLTAQLTDVRLGRPRNDPDLVVEEHDRRIYRIDSGEYVLSYLDQWIPGHWDSIEAVKTADLTNEGVPPWPQEETS